MNQINSVLVAMDGESKCGKTTFANYIAEEATYQGLFVKNAGDPNHLIANGFSPAISMAAAPHIATIHESFGFNDIETSSAGNAFRAAAFYHAMAELSGITLQKFVPEDTGKLIGLLATEGIVDILQNDDNIAQRVSEVAQLPGAQAVCGSIFARSVLEAYQKDGGGNLVIADARDPIGHLARNNMIGTGEGQIHPSTIIPIYIDTPADVAASRLSGDYATNLAHILERRLLDATRSELPVVRPARVTDDYDFWTRSINDSLTSGQIPETYRLDNHHEIDLEHIQFLGGLIASLASDMAIYSYAKTSV